uniref:Uncharacterized protein n=1 Tax=Anguilla anguilla TaxID=7936 RepID=A0A0E9WW81_ANGAN
MNGCTQFFVLGNRNVRTPLQKHIYTKNDAGKIIQL